ncbi:HNH endonuclease signature motif containing protein [Leucobacter sp. USCH14]|uniref:HNH endonuclease signature motif containing protein n=1 Tax=Leucobacter sp. USCH14 TaxID=3024838 RepID=UPI00403F1824
MILEIDEGVEKRFWAKVNKNGDGGCWVWVAHVDKLGYGRLRVGGRQGRMVGAHRVSWMLCVGEIPDGADIDHLCRNPSCVNPAHLEPVSHKENIRRGVAGAVNRARQLAKTHCPQGHEYDGRNTHLRPNGSRSCRACARDYARRRYVAKKEQSGRKDR